MAGQEKHFTSHTRLTLGGGWHDGYVVYEDEGHHLPVAIGLTMDGCLSLQRENAELAAGEFGEIYETLSFDEAGRTWHLSNAEDGEVEADGPFVVDGIELWHIGHELGYGWEAEEWVARSEALRA